MPGPGQMCYSMIQAEGRVRANFVFDNFRAYLPMAALAIWIQHCLRFTSSPAWRDGVSSCARTSEFMP